MPDKELLEAIGVMMDSKLEPIREEMVQMKRDMDKRFDKVDKKLEALESSINYAAKDAKAYIQRHEKEFHHV